MDKRGGGYPDSPSETFVSQCRKFSQGKLSVLCFRKIPVAKKFMDRRGGGVSRFSVESFLSQSAEVFRREPLSAVFQKNSGSEKLYG